MISYSSFTLENGLRVFVHEDRSVQIAVMNILYDVGSRDENPDKTGFAHLFELVRLGLVEFLNPLRIARNAANRQVLLRHVN